MQPRGGCRLSRRSNRARRRLIATSFYWTVLSQWALVVRPQQASVPNSLRASSDPARAVDITTFRAIGRAHLPPTSPTAGPRSEEHTSELQSRENLVCRLLLEKKKKKKKIYRIKKKKQKKK